jgi:hypothetical protein
MRNQGSIPEQDLRALLDSEQVRLFAKFNGCRVGVINSYANQKAVVQLVNTQAVFNTPMTSSVEPTKPTLYPYPLLVDVPVFVLSGGAGYITCPISKGDPCIVLFNDRDLDPWFTAGTLGAPPNSTRMHSLADGIALVGIRPATNPIPSNGSAIVVHHPSIKLDGNAYVPAFPTDTFVSADGATVTVVNGFVTNISR